MRAIGLGALGALLGVVFFFLIWAHTPYRADRGATLEVFRSSDIVVETVDEGILMHRATDTDDPSVGLIFIPGARVDPYAYLFQLSGAVEQHGLTVLITKPTLNLAFFDTRTVDDFTSAAPSIERWFIGGHSLGGVRACLMAPDSAVDGLVLFGSYCANDVSDSRLHVLSIAGENDLLSDLDTITAAAPRLPADAEFVVIEGANHAAFGDYGPQAGDGERTISSEQMRDELAVLLGTLLRL
ncbi:alpha/beta hydrolase [Microcella sp.]|uniref:alpha/beta hydrolase n=1 Tax=Microcella sp. TaxID=1913979 RepID=UPI002621330E|nr:alpha/beta hydrolase [Microcella sp.]